VALHSVRHAPFDAALRSFLSEAAGVLADHRKFLETPVAVPEEAVSSPEIFEAISRLAAGEKVFGVFAFKQKALKPAIDAIRILSRAPASDTEWTHVRDYLAWRGRFLDAQLRWRGLAPELGADAAGFASLRQLSDLTVALNDTMIAAPKIHGDFRTAMRVVAVGETQQLWPDEQRMRAMRTSLRNTASAVRLAAAREEVNRLSALFGPAAGKIGALAKSFLTSAVGRSDLDEARIEETWSRLLEAIDDLARHRPHFDALARPNDRTAKIRFCPRNRWTTEDRIQHQGRRRTRRNRIEATVSDASDPHLRRRLPIETRFSGFGLTVSLPAAETAGVEILLS
jgi:hypothetical protein